MNGTPPHRRRTDHDAGDAAVLRALVVDDQPSHREAIASLLERSGFNATAVSDCTEALATLRDAPDHHLLIVDCEIPGMSGLAFIRTIRAHEQFSDIYAVMLTAREDLETKIAALGFGFDDFLSKSAGEAEIAAKLSAARRLISRHNASTMPCASSTVWPRATS